MFAQILLFLAPMLAWGSVQRETGGKSGSLISARFGLPKLADFMLKQVFHCDKQQVSQVQSQYQSALIMKMTDRHCFQTCFRFGLLETVLGVSNDRLVALADFLECFFDLNFALQNLAIPEDPLNRRAHPFKLFIIAEPESADDLLEERTATMMQRAMRAGQPLTALLHQLNLLDREKILKSGDRLLVVYKQLWRTLSAALELMAVSGVCDNNADYMTLLTALTATHNLVYCAVSQIRALIGSTVGKRLKVVECATVSEELLAGRVNFYKSVMTVSMLPVELMGQSVSGLIGESDILEYLKEGNTVSRALLPVNNVTDALSVLLSLQHLRFKRQHEARLMGFSNVTCSDFVKPFVMNLWYGTPPLPVSFSVTVGQVEREYIFPKFLLDAFHTTVFAKSGNMAVLVKMKVVLCNLENDLQAISWENGKGNCRIKQRLEDFCQLSDNIYGRLFTQTIVSFTHSHYNTAVKLGDHFQFSIVQPQSQTETPLCRHSSIDYFSNRIKHALAVRHLSHSTPLYNEVVKMVVSQYGWYNLWTGGSGDCGKSLHIASMMASLFLWR